MKYLIKNSINQSFHNYAFYKRLVSVQNPLQKVKFNMIWKWIIRVTKKIYKSYTVYNRQSIVVHPNQIISTNLNWSEILRSE